RRNTHRQRGRWRWNRHRSGPHIGANAYDLIRRRNDLLIYEISPHLAPVYEAHMIFLAVRTSLAPLCDHTLTVRQFGVVANDTRVVDRLFADVGHVPDRGHTDGHPGTDRTGLRGRYVVLVLKRDARLSQHAGDAPAVIFDVMLSACHYQVHCNCMAHVNMCSRTQNFVGWWHNPVAVLNLYALARQCLAYGRLHRRVSRCVAIL